MENIKYSLNIESTLEWLDSLSLKEIEYLVETSLHFCNEHSLCCFSFNWFLSSSFLFGRYSLFSSASNTFVSTSIDCTSPSSLGNSTSSESDCECIFHLSKRQIRRPHQTFLKNSKGALLKRPCLWFPH